MQYTVSNGYRNYIDGKRDYWMKWVDVSNDSKHRTAVISIVMSEEWMNIDEWTRRNLNNR